MKNNEKQENCYICGKKLNFWFTASQKVDGMKVCTNCHFKRAKKDWDQGMDEVKKEFNSGIAEYKRLKESEKNKESKNASFVDKMDNLGKKLTVGLTIPIFLLILGVFTFPIGIIFWIIGLIVFFKTFFK